MGPSSGRFDYEQARQVEETELQKSFSDDAELTRMLHQYDHIPDSEARVALADAAVRRADSLGNVDAGYLFRMLYMDACQAVADLPRELTAFVWCLSASDEDPQRYNPLILLSHFQFHMKCMWRMPQIELSRIRDCARDFESRLRASGVSLKPHYASSIVSQFWTGNHEEARHYFTTWKDEQAHHFDHCPACELDTMVRWTLRFGDDEGGLRKAVPLVDGSLSCEFVPLEILPRIAHAFRRAGRQEEAASCFRKSLRRIEHDPSPLCSWDDLLAHATRANEESRARRIFVRILQDYHKAADPSDQFTCCLACRDYLLAARRGKFVLGDFEVPRAFDFHDSAKDYAPTELADWFHNEALRIASLYDTRNGNDFFVSLVADDSPLRWGD